MSLQIDESASEEISILTLRGQLTFGNADRVRENILGLAAKGHSKIVVELTDVSFIDSTGLGALVGCHASLQKKKGALKLVNPNRRNLELLLATQLHTVLDVFNGVEDGVNSFFPERESKPFDFSSFAQKPGEAAAQGVSPHPKAVRDESWFFPIDKAVPPADVREREPALEIEHETRDGWCIVRPTGRADGHTANELETALTGAAKNNDKVAVDLSSVDYISSAGLRAVLNGARAAQIRHGEFVLCRPRPSVSKILEISGIANIIKVQDLPF